MNTPTENLMAWLFNPSKRILNQENIQRGRLLSAILLLLMVLIMVIVGLVVQADPADLAEPTVQGAIGLLGIYIAMYGLNKAGYINLAAMGLIVPFAALFIYIPFFSGESPVFLPFMLIPIILIALFFSFRWVVITSLGLLGFIYFLIAQQDPSRTNLVYWNMRNLWYFLVIGTGLILTYVIQSNALENIRREKLRQIHEQVSANEARLRALVENSLDFIFEIDQDGNILFINRLAELYTGKNIREVLPPNYHGQAQEVIQKAFKGLPQSIEVEMVAPNGQRLWNSARIGPVMQAGKVTSLTVVMTDIQVQKEAQEKIRLSNLELEARVQARTKELEANNQELEAFSYSVSHDLRAPLRSIDGFARILLEDYAPQLDTEGQRHLARVRASAQRMGQLIDDLLNFSRLGRQPINKHAIDSMTLVQQVLDELNRDMVHGQVEIVIGDLPECEADLALLKQVWVNLLSNALKYSSKRAMARVEVGWTGAAFFVRDNGAGFDMRYADKLFGVFQRLHRGDEFEGTGVGLANVKRIVERHGGRIWAEAEVDKGATFYFTLGEVGRVGPEASVHG